VPTIYKGLLPEIELWEKKNEKVELVEIEDSNKGYKPMGSESQKKSEKKQKWGTKMLTSTLFLKRRTKIFLHRFP